MNKKELRTRLREWQKENNIDLYECYVTHGGAMVLNGVIADTVDIDLRVKETVWRRLVEVGYTSYTLPACGTKPETRQLEVADGISVQLADRMDSFADLIFENGIAYTNIPMTLRHYQELNRDKDQGRIGLLLKLV